jgi:hypothetical protein
MESSELIPTVDDDDDDDDDDVIIGKMQGLYSLIQQFHFPSCNVRHV